MKRFSLAIAVCALGMLFVLPGAAFPQATTTKTKIPQKQDPAQAALNQLLAAAQAALDRKDFSAAAQDYQDYLAKKPDDAYAHFQLGYAYTAMQRPGDAKPEYEKAIALAPEDPRIAPAYQNLGLLWMSTNPAVAASNFRHAVDLAPKDARARWLLGVALERAGKGEAAIPEYQAAAKLDEKDPEIRNSLAYALLKTQRYDDAEAAFRATLSLNPSAEIEAEAHRGLGQVLLDEKRRDEGLAELGRYLETHPDDRSVRLARASVLAETGKNDEALAELDRATKYGPEGLPELLLRSRIDYEAKRYDDAIAALDKAKVLAPNDANVFARLGHVYLEKKDYPKAIRALGVAWKIDPQGADVLSDLITAQFNNKNYPVALQGIGLLEKRQPLPPAALFMRATCYDKLGQPAEALDAYRKFLAQNKDENTDMYFDATARVRILTIEVQNKKR